MTLAAVDIGGANLKCAWSDGRARTLPFVVWREPEALAGALGEALGGCAYERLLVTMTAELCDCFESRRQGVGAVLDAVERATKGRPIHVWSTTEGFLDPAAARAQPMAVAAANWHALATHIARHHAWGSALLIDIGSTTSDLIPLRDGRVVAVGLTDTARLASGELVYIGAQWTPLMALATELTLRGQRIGVMAEHFATLADAMLLIGEREESPACIEAADGCAMARRGAAVRVLRMVGADLDTHTPAEARELAKQFVDAAVARLIAAARRVTHRAGELGEVIVSGSGEWLAAQVAAAALPGVAVRRLSATIGAEASDAACAAALLRLWEQR